MSGEHDEKDVEVPLKGVEIEEPSAKGHNVQEEWFEVNFRNRVWQNVFWLIMNYTWSCGVFGLIITASVQKYTDVEKAHEGRSKNFDIVLLSIGVALLWGFVYLFFVRFCARGMAWLTAIGMCGSTLLLGSVCVYYAVTLVEVGLIVCAWLGAIVVLGLFVSQLVFLSCYWKKVEITCMLWEMASQATLSNFGVVMVAFIVVMSHLCVVAFLIWGCVVISYWKGAEWTMLFPIIALFWNYWITIAVMRVSVAGSVASWYYGQGNRAIQGCCPAVQSLWRAMTKSFGAVSFGALLMSFVSIFLAAVKTLQEAIDMRKDRDDANCCCLCLIKCCLCQIKMYCFCFLGALEWMSEYAWCYVAMKGVDFMTGGREAIKLIRQHGIQALVTEGITYWMGMIGAILGFTFSVCAVWAYLAAKEREWDALYVFVAFLGAAVVSYLWTIIIDCSVDSVLVCFVADLDQYQKTNHLFARKTFVKQLEAMGWKGGISSASCTV